ncbi:hypothetical protein IPJ91_03160 [bacterium]|nr:MAG: hypothetical protein IPJ91_03160 [bacterium]
MKNYTDQAMVISFNFGVSSWNEIKPYTLKIYELEDKLKTIIGDEYDGHGFYDDGLCLLYFYSKNIVETYQKIKKLIYEIQLKPITVTLFDENNTTITIETVE